MAIHWKNGCRDLLVRALDIQGQRLHGLKMAEFGNQRLKFDPGWGARRLQMAKPYFEFFGVRHVSFDTNGEGGALPWDLGQPITDERLRAATGIGLEEFDVVTDFGTLEHVRRGQRAAFANAQALCRTGGLMVHALPRAGTCARHGDWKYTAAWFQKLAWAQHYEVEHLTEWDKSAAWPGRIAPGTQVYVLAILRKVEPGHELLPPWQEPSRR